MEGLGVLIQLSNRLTHASGAMVSHADWPTIFWDLEGDFDWSPVLEQIHDGTMAIDAFL